MTCGTSSGAASFCCHGAKEMSVVFVAQEHNRILGINGRQGEVEIIASIAPALMRVVKALFGREGASAAADWMRPT